MASERRGESWWMGFCMVGLGSLGLGMFGLGSCSPSTPAPSLVTSVPADGAVDVPRTRWVRLDFEVPPLPAALETMAIGCDEGAVDVTATAIGTRVILNPKGELPAGRCEASWLGAERVERVTFTVAAPGLPAPVLYDRDDPSTIAPVPDDVFVTEGAATPTGKSIAFPTLDRPLSVVAVVGALTDSIAGADGFSPLTPIVIEVPDAVDPSSIPTDPAASLEPDATMVLLRLDGIAPERVPFWVQPKAQTNVAGEVEHQLVVFPAVALEPAAIYGLVLTREAVVDPTRPLAPSPFTAAMLDPDDRSTPGRIRAGELADQVLAAARILSPALEDDDVALALRFSTRSLDDAGDDLRAGRAAIEAQYASSPPTYTVESVDPDPDPASPIAAIVRGTWDAPVFADGASVVRGADGRPALQGVAALPFIMTLPKNAPAGGAPVIMSQHGNPGSAEDNVPRMSRLGLSDAGFAVIGFTQPLDRATAGSMDPIGEQLQGIFAGIIGDRRFPDTMCLLPNLEQLGFVQFLPRLADLDVLPIGAADGTPELDFSAPLGFLGVSYGSHHGGGFIAFAPEIGAAALTVGGGRYFASIFHQDTTGVGASGVYATVTELFPDVTRTELYVALALAQTALDEQEWAHRQRFLFREPEGGAPRTSLLLTESLGDLWIPPFGTTTAAEAFGVPHVGPLQRTVPFLEPVDAPLQGNVAPGITGGFYQFVAAGVEGASPSPGCESIEDGHRCAQDGSAAVAQRVHFFETALTGAPEIIDPLAP